MRRRESRDCSVLPLTIIDIAFFSSWLSLLYELLSRFTFCYFDTSKSLFSPNTVTRYFKEFWTTINISAYEWNVTSCATTLHIAAAIHSFSGTVHLCNVKMWYYFFNWSQYFAYFPDICNASTIKICAKNYKILLMIMLIWKYINIAKNEYQEQTW